MRKTWLALLAGLIVLAYAESARPGQEVLDSLIDKALTDYPELSAAKSTQDAARSSARAAGALPDPMLSVGVLNLPANSFSLHETPMSGVAVGLAQRIPWPGKLSARSDLASIRHRRTEANAEIIRNQIIREVTDAYSEYSYWLESRVILEDYLELLKATRSVTETRYANGDASAQDVLRISSMISRTDIRLLNTNQRSYSSMLRLWRAVGDSSMLAGLPPHLPEPDGSDSRGPSIEANPMLLNAELAVESANTQQRLARSDYWPDITLGIDYRIRSDLAGDPVNGADFLTFKLGLDIPVWFFAKQKHQVRSAELMSVASQEKERSVREMLTTRFRDAQSMLALAYESIQQYDISIVPEAEAALQAAEVAYEVGQIDFNALLTAQSDLYDIHLERLDLLRKYNQTRAALAELHGLPYKR